MTSFYQRHIEPALVSLACGARPIAKVRREVVPYAAGRVLEIGFGSGHNLPYYDQTKIERLYALEPSEEMRARAARRLERSPLDVEILGLKAEQIPLDAASVDAVVMTFTLCTIPEPRRALAELRRVLKPGGALYFAEHGLAPDVGVARWQSRLNGVWGKLAGGCHLNRDISALIAEAGFRPEAVAADYLPHAPKFASFVTRGCVLSPA